MVIETKRYAGHTDKVSGLNESKNLATREELEAWGINSTLRNCQIAVYLWNSGTLYCIKFASGQLNNHVSIKPQASRPWYPIVYEA